MIHEIKMVLIVEDDPVEVKRLEQLLERANYTHIVLTHVESLADARQVIPEKKFDAILLDLGLPDSRGVETVKLMNQYAPDVPVIVLTGDPDESVGFEAIKQGAQDYLQKDKVSAPLLFRVLHFAIERKRFMRERQQLIDELRIALIKINKLKGLIPICAYCRKIRDDGGFWDQFEEYLSKNSEVQFSHGICPECQTVEMEKFRKNLGKRKNG